MMQGCVILSSFSFISPLSSSTHGAGRRSFCRRGVGAGQTSIGDPQSFPKAGTASGSIRSDRRWIVCTLDAAWAHHPLRNYTQAFDSVKLAPRPEDTKVPPAVLAHVAEEAGPKGTQPENHRSGSPDETTQSHLGLSPNRTADLLGVRH